MTPPRSLPRHRSDAWVGGFAIDAPVYTASISASGGMVVAATERMCPWSAAREPIVQVDGLRGGGGVLAFGGTSADAPLFAAMQEGKRGRAGRRLDGCGS
jgi:hypothetical protein